MIGELLFPLSILAVRMNQRALVIVLEAEIYIYDISTMRLLHVIETTANPEAAASSPAPQSNGDVAIFSTTPITTANIIPLAHKSPLDRSREARIYSIVFNPVGLLMVFVSAHEMVHLFKLGERTTAASTATSVIATGSIERRDRPMDGGDEAYLDERKKGRGNGVPLLTHSVGVYLPNTLTETWEPSRDFAWLRVPSGPPGVMSISGLSGAMPKVMIFSSEGYFYSYNIDLRRMHADEGM
ncbi:autophagy protein [Pleurotus ostreatus]|uniref:Autophagy protein n=1 Tax=Pleurotus ostreatus TaxID=5322 RepID=A0A8H7DR64_PLEOS|nr:autophagy protein [Pleurotus ostreatus]KAF7426692.1 autophagy protein [Pleurotus ostreatus]